MNTHFLDSSFFKPCRRASPSLTSPCLKQFVQVGLHEWIFCDIISSTTGSEQFSFLWICSFFKNPLFFGNPPWKAWLIKRPGGAKLILRKWRVWFFHLQERFDNFCFFENCKALSGLRILNRVSCSSSAHQMTKEKKLHNLSPYHSSSKSQLVQMQHKISRMEQEIFENLNLLADWLVPKITPTSTNLAWQLFGWLYYTCCNNSFSLNYPISWNFHFSARGKMVRGACLFLLPSI